MNDDTSADGISRDGLRSHDLPDLVPPPPSVAMIMTMVGRQHTSRPVTIADVQEARLSFLVARRSEWVAAIAGNQALVHVTIAHDDSERYLSLNGAAIVVTDDAEAKRLWTDDARIWFDGPDDPELGVVHFDVTDGTYWLDRTTRIGRAIEGPRVHE